MEFGRNAGCVRPTHDTRKIWDRVYPGLSEGMAGLLGAVTSRAEAQVMRLSMLYALLDASFDIRPQHLVAGLALWDFAFSSARYIFGDSLGDPVADEIIGALKGNPAGLTRSDINNLFGRHKRSSDISRALGLLLKRGLAGKVDVQIEGRSVERWHAK